MTRITTIVMVVILSLGACSMRSAMERMTSEEDRAFANEMVARLRSGDAAWLQARFDPQLWAQSGKDAANAGQYYPEVPGTTEMVSFSTSTSTTNGAYQRTKEFALVTHGGARWTTTSFSTHSTGGPDLVVAWRVTPHTSEPSELTMLNSIDNVLPWIQAALVAVLVGGVVLVVWLVRRSRRRRRDPLEGQRGSP